MSKIDRPHAVPATVYKLKWVGEMGDESFYVTISNLEINGKLRPFELFINTANTKHYPWTVALTRMISAVFRRDEDVKFVAEELMEVFDPEGGHHIGDKAYPSLLALIGETLWNHMEEIGYFEKEEEVVVEEEPEEIHTVYDTAIREALEAIYPDGPDGEQVDIYRAGSETPPPTGSYVITPGLFMLMKEHGLVQGYHVISGVIIVGHSEALKGREAIRNVVTG